MGKLVKGSGCRRRSPVLGRPRKRQWCALWRTQNAELRDSHLRLCRFVFHRLSMDTDSDWNGSDEEYSTKKTHVSIVCIIGRGINR